MTSVDQFTHTAMSFWSLPAIQYARHYSWFLFSVSGGFWFVSWFLSKFVLAIHDGLSEDFAELVAVLYNIFLAIVFASIICLSITVAGANSSRYIWHQAAGFVFVYLILGAVYSDSRTRAINEYSLLGYYAGILAYLGFAIFPQYLVNPLTLKCYSTAGWIGGGWFGRLLSVYGLSRGMSSLARSARDFFSFQPAIRVRQVHYD